MGRVVHMPQHVKVAPAGCGCACRASVGKSADSAPSSSTIEVGRCVHACVHVGVFCVSVLCASVLCCVSVLCMQACVYVCVCARACGHVHVCVMSTRMRTSMMALNPAGSSVGSRTSADMMSGSRL